MGKSGEFYSFGEVLKRLNIDETKLKRLVSEGEIRAFREGDQMKFRKADIENLDLTGARSEEETGVIDLAIFYGRNNYLHAPDGPMPGNLFATITEGLKEMAAACQDLWRNGAANERMTFRRLDETG